MAVPKRPIAQPAQRRRQDPAVRQAQILGAARRCFANAGFKATTVDDIAEEAGVSVGLLYRIFGSKTAIVEAIILEQVEAQIAQAFEIISNSKTGIDRGKILKSFEAASLDLQQLALTFEMAAEACRNKKLREFMQSRRAELYSKLMNRLTAGGMDRETAEQKFAELDLMGAIGSGAVIQGLTASKTSVAQTVEAVLKSIDRRPRK